VDPIYDPSGSGFRLTDNINLDGDLYIGGYCCESFAPDAGDDDDDDITYPPAFGHALMAGRDIDFTGNGMLDVSTGTAYANNNISLSGNTGFYTQHAYAVNNINGNGQGTIGGDATASSFSFVGQAGVIGTSTIESIPPIPIPSLDFSSYRAYASAHGEEYNTSIHISGSSDLEPSGGVMYVNGNLRISGSGNMVGAFIVTGDIFITRNGNQVKVEDLPALVSMTGNIHISGNGDYHGLIYCPSGTLDRSGSGTITGSIIAGYDIEKSGTWSGMIYELSYPSLPDDDDDSEVEYCYSVAITCDDCVGQTDTTTFYVPENVVYDTGDDNIWFEDNGDELTLPDFDFTAQDSLLAVASAIIGSSGNKYNGNFTMNGGILDMSVYTDNTLYVDGDILLKACEVTGGSVNYPGILVASGDITVRALSGVQAEINDNILLISGGTVDLQNETQFGTDYSLIAPSLRPTTLNEIFALGDIIINEDVNAWASFYAGINVNLQGEAFGLLYAHTAFQFTGSSPYFEGAMFVRAVTDPDNALNAGSIVLNTNFPVSYFGTSSLSSAWEFVPGTYKEI